MPPAGQLHPRTAALVVAVLLCGLLAACGTASPPAGEAARTEEEHVVGHVHGLGINPANDKLYVAGHYGVFRVDGRTPRRIADRWQDTMAFTVTGPDTFLASGHPDLREDAPPHLGLIESTDAAQTWESLSLQGEADFHALEVTGKHLFGYDAVTGTVLATSDRTRWTPLATGEFLDLAAPASVPDGVFATTPDGTLRWLGIGGEQRVLPDAPRLAWIDTTADDGLVGATVDGNVFVAADPSGPWEPAGSVPGRTGAIDAARGTWHVASDEGIYASRDRGRTWDDVVDVHG